MTETGKLTELQEEIILSLADNNMNISKVANSIYRHRNAIIYHIEKIRNLTGKDPLNFHELNDLIGMVKKASPDFVRVIRCKKCDWYSLDTESCDFWPDGGYRDPEHFCGEGRPRR